MNKATRRQHFEARGWKVATVDEFLNLTPEESALVELRLLLSRLVKSRRGALHLSQAALAERIHSSQSRVAKIEAGDSSISLDLIVRAALATGATREELGHAIVAGPGDGLSKGCAELDDAFGEMLSDNEAVRDINHTSDRELVPA